MSQSDLTIHRFVQVKRFADAGSLNEVFVLKIFFTVAISDIIMS